jgi:hypothetical protein
MAYFLYCFPKRKSGRAITLVSESNQEKKQIADTKNEAKINAITLQEAIEKSPL